MGRNAYVKIDELQKKFNTHYVSEKVPYGAGGADYCCQCGEDRYGCMCMEEHRMLEVDLPAKGPVRFGVYEDHIWFSNKYANMDICEELRAAGVPYERD